MTENRWALQTKHPWIMVLNSGGTCLVLSNNNNSSNVTPPEENTRSPNILYSVTKRQMKICKTTNTAEKSIECIAMSMCNVFSLHSKEQMHNYFCSRIQETTIQSE
jgi:hypothetical protein